ncbi:MAG TPA: N-acetyltransferase [Gaiellaceae bacterium]|jgi:putative acetyltransferase
MIVRPHRSDDHEAAKRIYAEAFRRPEDPDSLPSEAPLFEALCEAGDFLPEFSFTAEAENEAVGHVTASKGTVAAEPVVAVGPIGVLPEHQGMGIGSALMEALLSAADAAQVPLVVLLGSPRYYSRFGFQAAEELGVISPDAAWGDAFQARPLTAYSARLAGPFRYAPAFSP